MGFGGSQGRGLNPFKQVEITTDPVAVAGTGQLYWKDLGSGNELYAEDESGNVTQITKEGAPNNIFPDSLYVTGGELGLGTQTPSSTFEIEGSSGDLILEIDNNAANSANFQIQNGAGNARADLVLDNNLHITMKGQRVGIIQTDPQYTFDVNGDGRITSDMNLGGSVVLDQISAPGTTTDKLYNVAGALTWNGTDISAGGGGGISSIVTKTTTYTATTSDDVILCDGTFTLTLYAASGNSGEVLYLKNISTGTITIDADGSETIDGALAKYLAGVQYESLTIVCDGSNWHII